MYVYVFEMYNVLATLKTGQDNKINTKNSVHKFIKSVERPSLSDKSQDIVNVSEM